MGRLMGARLAAAVAVLLLVLVGALPAAAQPTVEFGPAIASGSFGQTVVFSTTFRTDTQPTRVEMLSRLPDEQGERVTIAALEPAGDGWRASVQQGGHIVPNTSWDYRFRVVTPDGSVTGPAATYRLLDERFEWDVLEGEHVNVWTYEGGDDFARRALRIADAAIVSSAELLGVEDIEPVDFLLYTDTREFRDAMGPATRENVGGQAHPAIRTLFGLIEPRQIDSDWADELITHELAHIVFHEAVDNPYQYPPRWLNEGLAVYLSKGYDEGDRRMVQGAAAGGTIIPLEGLGGQFPTRAGRQSLAYAESISAVDHFVETYGQDRLVELINSFGEGTGLDGAFLAATGEGFAAFDAAWLASLGADPPEPYGPTESLPGPVPDAWTTAPAVLVG
jgi:Peptidase MA superfamily